jgi:predicted GTPase
MAAKKGKKALKKERKHSNVIAQATQAFKDRFEAAKNGRFVFLLVGLTGAGKSSTVNTLLGRKVAPVGDWEATTFEVKRYNFTMNGIAASVVDTPGLCDKIKDVGNNEKYLTLMHSTVPSPDCLWYVTHLDQPRVSGDEQEAIALITAKFTTAIWDHAIIVFTRSAKVRDFQTAIKNRSRVVRAAIAEHGQAANASKIPVVPVENDAEDLQKCPHLTNWRGDLYSQVVSVIDEEGLIPWVIGTSEMVGPAGSAGKKSLNGSHPDAGMKLTEVHQKRVIKRISASIIPALAGIGMTLGNPFGAIAIAVGGTLGAAFGLLAWLFS